jgi:histidinol-phosphatase
MDDLAFALELADRADTLTMERFGALDLRIDTKPDLTPVTDADEGTERCCARCSPSSDPETACSGGVRRHRRRRQWVIDPIDGTKNFVRGVPVWCTLIALLEDGVPTVGVVSAPALSRRWWAALGRGAHTSFAGTSARSPCRVCAT